MFFMNYCLAVSESIPTDLFIVFLASSSVMCGRVAGLQSHESQTSVYNVGHSKWEEHGLQS